MTADAEADEHGNAEATGTPSGGTSAEPRPPRDWRHRAPRLLLLAGLAIAALVVAPAIPRDQTLVFRLDEGLQPVRMLTATWTRYGQEEPTGGVTLRFPDHAPRHVRHKLRVPNGEYVLSIALERGVPETTSPGRANLGGEHTARIEYVRRVDLEGGETLVVLRQEY